MSAVLVVDDEPHLVRTLAINLRARDYAVETAGDGRSALQAFHDAAPDLVVLDLGLPDLDGVEVLRRIRETSDVPVIVLSARTDSVDKVEALDLGADDYVTKPFGMDEFLARVRVALRRGREETDQDEPPFTTEHFSLDFGDRRAVVSGNEVRPDPDRVETAGDPGSARRAPGQPAGPPAGGLGPRVRQRVELPARLRQPAAPQARARPGPAALPPHRARPGLSPRWQRLTQRPNEPSKTPPGIIRRKS